MIFAHCQNGNYWPLQIRHTNSMPGEYEQILYELFKYTNPDQSAEPSTCRTTMHGSISIPIPGPILAHIPQITVYQDSVDQCGDIDISQNTYKSDAEQALHCLLKIL